jgi:hypothetical protein
MPYALFDRERQVGPASPTEAEVWKQALASGLIDDVPVADDAGGQVLPAGYHVREVAVERELEPRPGWKLPPEIL